MPKIERNLPPQEYQDHLTFLGGVNKYDAPNFKLAWAQYETFVTGGTWSVGEKTFTGYRRILAGSGEPCWMLMQWHDASEYGTPVSYYIQNYDESSGFQLLGEYPYSGRYEVLYHLRWHEFIDGNLSLHTIPLGMWMFEVIIPVIRAAQSVSLAKRKEACLEIRRLEEDAKTGEIERQLRDKSVPFHGAVSFGRQGIRSTAIDRKQLELNRVWGQLQQSARKFRPGFQTG